MWTTDHATKDTPSWNTPDTVEVQTEKNGCIHSYSLRSHQRDMGFHLAGRKPGPGRHTAVAGGPAAVAGHKREDLLAGGHHTGGPAGGAAGHTPAAAVVAAGTQVREGPARQHPILRTLSAVQLIQVQDVSHSLPNM